MVWTPPVTNLYHFSYGQLSTTFSNATEVAQLAAANSQPQPITYHGVRHGRSNWLALKQF